MLGDPTLLDIGVGKAQMNQPASCSLKLHPYHKTLVWVSEGSPLWATHTEGIVVCLVIEGSACWLSARGGAKARRAKVTGN